MNFESSNKKPTPTSILCELAKLKSQQNFLERTQTVTIQIPNLDGDQDQEEKTVLADVEKLQNNFKIEFPKAKLDAKHRITNIFKNITNFETNMLSSACLKNVHVIAYREEVIKMDNNLSEYSQSITLQNEILKAKFKDIESSIPAAEKILKEIPKHSLIKQKPLQEVLKNPISTFAFTEVKEFDRFLINCGGHSGSWKDEEHNIYIKFKNKFKSNIDRIVECVNLVLPR